MDGEPIWDRCTVAQRRVLVLLANHGWENQRIARKLGGPGDEPVHWRKK